MGKVMSLGGVLSLLMPQLRQTPVLWQSWRWVAALPLPPLWTMAVTSLPLPPMLTRGSGPAIADARMGWQAQLSVVV